MAHSSSSSDDEGSGQPTVLPVARFTTFDPNVAPATGAEYLRRVQLQAAACKKIAVSKRKVPSSRRSGDDDDDHVLSTGILGSESGFYPCHPPDCLPVDVQEDIVNQFTITRKRIDEIRDRLTDSERVRIRAKFPSITEYLYWKKYCMGIDCETGTDSSDDSDCETQEAKCLPNKPNQRQQRKWTKMKPPCKGHPNLKLLLALDQQEMLVMLRFNIKWISEFGVSQKVSYWIYSILVSIEQPLTCDAYSVIRDVTRVLSSVRRDFMMYRQRNQVSDSCHQDQRRDTDEAENGNADEVEGEESSLYSCHLLICLIGRYFHQLDMIDG